MKPSLAVFGPHTVSPLDAVEGSLSMPETGAYTSANSKAVPGITLNKINKNGTEKEYPSNSVAIVGMACRFPNADSVDAFWKLLTSGVSMVEPLPLDRLRVNDEHISDYSDMKLWGSFLRHPDTFYHRFFKKSAREVQSWDPEKRVLLEVVYEALESSGYFGIGSESRPTDYGCYISTAANNYYDNVSCHPPDSYPMLGTSRAFFNGRISHQFGFTGPTMTIDTDYSSSLVAINAACKAIQAGECSRAIAAGTRILTNPVDYENHAVAGLLSPTGACKPFDASANGYCLGEGVGAVVLKSLSSAIDENDNILGVIVGSAVSQNLNTSHATVPCHSAMSVYKEVLELARVDSRSVSYVEAHGTGTQVDDPMKCQSIRETFGGHDRRSTLYFGSVEGHIGNSEESAGIAGLIKVLLMIQHGMIPGQARFSSLNLKIPALEPDNMEIPRVTQPWNTPSRLAVISSFGAAGNNAAIAVRQPPEFISTSTDFTGTVNKYPLFLSAASANSLSMQCDTVLRYLKDQSSEKAKQILLPDLLFNIADRGNHALPHIFAQTVTDRKDLEDKLKEGVSGLETIQVDISHDPRPTVLLFGGQENNFVGLSEELFSRTKLLRRYLNQCDDTLKSLGFSSIYPAIFQRTEILDITILHAALFSLQYSCAACWIDSGVKVSAVVGHSFGQLTALCVSGCLSLEDTLKLVVGRASLMVKFWGPERGSMFALQTSREIVSDILDALKSQPEEHDLEIACYNNPQSHIVVGSAKSIDALENFIAESSKYQNQFRVRRLAVTHGFHSKFTEPLLPTLESLAKELTWKKPKIPIETCTDSQSYTEPDFKLILEHTRHPVFFEQAINRLSQKFPSCTWLEAGGQASSIMLLVRGCLGSDAGLNHRLFPSQISTSNAHGSLAEVTVDLWKLGYKVQFWPFHRFQKQQYKQLILPPYQFEKNKHWMPSVEGT